MSTYLYLQVILTNPSWRLPGDRPKYKIRWGQNCLLWCFVGQYFSPPLIGGVSIVFRVSYNQKELIMFSLWVAYIATSQGTCLCGVCLATGWWVISSDAMLWAITILSVFCRDTSALRGSCYSYLSDKCNYKLPFSPPTRCLGKHLKGLSDVSHAGRVAWGRFTAVAGSFAVWPTAETWLGWESSFLPSLCVSSLTHNHFSLPTSL